MQKLWIVLFLWSWMMVLPRKVDQYFSNFAKLQLIKDAEVQKYVWRRAFGARRRYLSPCCRRGKHHTDRARLHAAHTCHLLSLSQMRRSSSMPQTRARKLRPPPMSLICSSSSTDFFCSPPHIPFRCHPIAKSLHHIQCSSSGYQGGNNLTSWKEVAAAKIHLTPSRIPVQQQQPSSTRPTLFLSFWFLHHTKTKTSKKIPRPPKKRNLNLRQTQDLLLDTIGSKWSLNKTHKKRPRAHAHALHSCLARTRKWPLEGLWSASFGILNSHFRGSLTKGLDSVFLFSD